MVVALLSACTGLLACMHGSVAAVCGCSVGWVCYFRVGPSMGVWWGVGGGSVHGA